MKPSPPLAADHIRALRPYSPGKPIEEVQRELGLHDVIKLASNENPLGPSPAALEALGRVGAGLALYPDGACYNLVQALAETLDVPQGQIVVGNGSDELIHYLGLAYLQPGDELLTADPTFVRYEAAAILNRAAYVTAPLVRYAYDLDAMAALISPRTRLIFIANPNNPTGTIVGRDNLERFLSRVPERAVVVLDEAYAEYVVDPEYPDGLTYVREALNVIVLRTFSKIHALAGLRVGYGIARPEIVAALHQVREPFNVNTLGQVAALASLRDPDQVSISRRMNLDGCEQLRTGCERLGLHSVPTHANFMLIEVGDEAEAVYDGLLRRGVIVRAGSKLGVPRCLRVTVGKHEDNVRFLEALEQVIHAPSTCGVT